MSKFRTILPVAISELIDDDIIREDTNKLTSAIMDSAKDDNTETNDDWRNIFYHNIRRREPLKNIEGNQNMGLYVLSRCYGF